MLWTRFLHFNPQAPLWENRDRFVLSDGHGSALLNSLWHLAGNELPWGSCSASGFTVDHVCQRARALLNKINPA